MAEEDKLDMSLNDIIERDQKGKTEGSNKRVYVGNLAYETHWTSLKDHMRQAGEVAFADILRDFDGRSKGCGVVEYETAEGFAQAISTLNDTKLDNRMIFVREDREGRRPATTSRGGFGGGFHSGRGNFQGGFQRGGYQGGSGYHGGGGFHRGGGGGFHGGHGPQGGHGGHGSHGGYNSGYGNGYGRGGYNSGYNYNRPPPSRPDDAGRKLFVGNLPYTTRWQELKDLFAAAGPVIRADILLTPDGRSKGSGVVVFETKEAAQDAIKRFDGMEMNNRQIMVREDRYV